MSDNKLVRDVFGVVPKVRNDSYVDRGDLDAKIGRYLTEDKHIALRGVSKCGKSWLRQQVISNPLVVQCRLGKTVLDIYREALGAVGIRLEVTSTHESSLTGTVEATAEVGTGILAKLAAKWGLAHKSGDTVTTEPTRENINDLSFIADILLASGRRLVIEDFHYLALGERRRLAFDLKALWDYELFVVIVGVWSGSNQLIELNSDLTGRVREVPIHWDDEDLEKIFAKGGSALNINFGPELRQGAIVNCYGNAGILQRLIDGLLEEARITKGFDAPELVADLTFLEDAALAYADELNSVYQTFATRVSTGVRSRRNGTGIYGHALAVVMDATDDELIHGVSLQRIFQIANSREPRIQLGNLRKVLERFDALQVDEDGRGLVVSYDRGRRMVSVVDRQLLLYRKYATVAWPWEDLIRDANESGDKQYEVDESLPGVGETP